MSRLAVYVFWERKGIVRDYVVTYLKGLTSVADKIYMVVNGEICQQGKRRIEEETGAVVLQRSNEGVDFWAYKTALECEGEGISAYDEVILCNCSCYGPIYPFMEMFEEMGRRNVDFWGVTEWPFDEGGYRGTWILSYFMVFSSRMFLSDTWQEYWKNLPSVTSREDCIKKHETKFTTYFAERGFSYDVYCPNTPEYIDSTIEAPDKLVIEQRCPLIKRKAFCVEYLRILSYHRGLSANRVLDYIKKHDLYDVDMIYDDLLSTQHYAMVKDNLHLNYFLPKDYVISELPAQRKIAVFYHVFYEDLLDKSFSYLKSIPEDVDIYITSPKKELRKPVEARIKACGLHHTRFDIVDARGRAESAFLVYARQFIDQYDYVCIVHDKKSSFLRPECVGIEFGLHNLDALLASSAYVKNIISTFEQNPRLGILAPMNLVHGAFSALAGSEWGANYQGTVDFLRRCDIDVPISPDVPPIAPMGAMFWFRPASLKRLLEIDWAYDDFPEEPLELDGTIIHILERAYPFVAQAEGYFTGWVSTVEDAQVHMTNVYYLYRRANLSSLGAADSHAAALGSIGVRRAVKEHLKKRLPPRFWLFLKNFYFRFKGRSSDLRRRGQ